MPTYPTTFISCPYCRARVQASVLAEREYPGDDESEPSKYQFIECTHCSTVMLGRAEMEEDEEFGRGWGDLDRKWPLPDAQLHANIPQSVRLSLQEAQRCFANNAFMACAVMCGRAIEGLSKDKTKARYLGEGLKRMKAAKTIDDKLFEWGEALRNERNIGAHAGEATVSYQTANDVLDFSLAITEYVYVLDEKFKSYKARKSKVFPPSGE
jgi:DNA-directed RNA polymerase subunit RPC12/RpoP